MHQADIRQDRRAPAPGVAGHRGSPGPRLRWALVAGLVAILAVLCAGVVGAFHLAHAGKSLPGVTVEGVPVGGLTRAAVQDKLRATVARHRGVDPVVLTLAGKDYPVTPKQAGYDVDIAATAGQVMRAGRTGNILTQGWADVSARWHTRRVPIDDTVSPLAVRKRIDAIAATVDAEPDPGGISVDADTLQVTEQAPRAGIAADRGAAARLVLRDLDTPGPDTAPLPVTVRSPAVTAAQVGQVAAQARTALAAPIVLTADSGESITVTPTALAPLLGSRVTGNAIALVVATDKLNRLVGQLSSKVDVAPRSAKLAVAGTPPIIDTKGDLTFTPQPADVSVTAPSQTGRAVDEKAAAAEITRLAAAGDHQGKLVVAATAPPVSSEDARGVTQLIATFTTHHKCCQNRVTNIHRMAELVDGTVVAPGAQFSLNGVAGRRTSDKGFLSDGEILGGKLVDVIGGGVSQFSTTTFNAAFFAGLPIEAYQAHSFYISRYPPGRESTLNYPSIDLKWTNDTAHPILVKAGFTDTSVTVSLYGDNGGRTVSAMTDSRTPTGDGGFRIAVTRVISGPNAGRKTFVTRYQPSTE